MEQVTFLFLRVTTLKIGRAFSYDSILLGRIGTLELEDGGSVLHRNPNL